VTYASHLVSEIGKLLIRRKGFINKDYRDEESGVNLKKTRMEPAESIANDLTLAVGRVDDGHGSPDGLILSCKARVLTLAGSLYLEQVRL
jgi:hypothetical protein